MKHRGTARDREQQVKITSKIFDLLSTPEGISLCNKHERLKNICIAKARCFITTADDIPALVASCKAVVDSLTAKEPPSAPPTAETKPPTPVTATNTATTTAAACEHNVQAMDLLTFDNTIEAIDEMIQLNLQKPCMPMVNGLLAEFCDWLLREDVKLLLEKDHATRLYTRAVLRRYNQKTLECFHLVEFVLETYAA